MSEVNNLQRKSSNKYDPPDGSYGYMICLAFTVIMVILMGYHESYSTIFKDKFYDLEMDASIAVLKYVSALCIAVSGMFTSNLLKLMTIRKLGFIAVVLYSAGSFCTAFCRSIVILFIFQGVQNLGHGILFNLSFTILTQYFVKKRLFIISLAQSIVAAAGFAIRPLVKWTLNHYGCQGTLLMITAISLHNLAAVALMQPVAWHQKKVPENKEIDTNAPANEDRTRRARLPPGAASFESTTSSHRTKSPELSGRVREKLLNKVLDGDLRQFVISNACMGLSLCLYSDVIYFNMLSPALYYMGWNENLVAKALLLFTLGNIITRILFTVSTKWLTKVGSHELYVIGLLIAALSRLVVMGAARCSLIVLHPIVIADSVTPENFSRALGISMLSYGVVNVILGPSMIFWTIELVYKKSEHKRRPIRCRYDKSRFKYDQIKNSI
ncbi:unnamed protein product [Leptidea sinapis]|uniref:Major facilitator superfamily (MFS) profile domain-containing protein n=1 Tax=Leptidea sinapis TaxID=189913 RepID=A0A5E4QAB7_9NEOP|nr:unnamed protein product [Leptidea sinapis]